MTAEGVLADLVRTIEATGGLVPARENPDYLAPATDPDWVDLGECYLNACRILGRVQQITLKPADPEPSEFYLAWHWLYDHPAFAHTTLIKGRPRVPGDWADQLGVDTTQDRSMVTSHFLQCLDIDVQQVDPVTRHRTDEPDGVVEVWLECGPWLEPEQLEEAERPYHKHGTASHDYDLDCGGPTFEAAILVLAELVRSKYGDYEQTAS